MSEGILETATQKLKLSRLSPQKFFSEQVQIGFQIESDGNMCFRKLIWDKFFAKDPNINEPLTAWQY